MMDDTERLVKIVLRHEEGDDVHVETPWARQVGENLYELDNLLWYVYGVSCGDVLGGHPKPAINGQLKAGHFE